MWVRIPLQPLICRYSSMDRTGSFYLPDASSILAIDIYIPVAQWKRALGYEPRFVARSNRVRDAIGDYLSWLEYSPDKRIVAGSNPASPIIWYGDRIGKCARLLSGSREIDMRDRDPPVPLII